MCLLWHTRSVFTGNNTDSCDKWFEEEAASVRIKAGGAKGGSGSSSSSSSSSSMSAPRDNDNDMNGMDGMDDMNEGNMASPEMAPSAAAEAMSAPEY